MADVVLGLMGDGVSIMACFPLLIALGVAGASVLRLKADDGDLGRGTSRATPRPCSKWRQPPQKEASTAAAEGGVSRRCSGWCQPPLQ